MFAPRTAELLYIDFPTFDAASQFAAWVTSPRGLRESDCSLRRSGDAFQVGIPYPLSVSKACEYIYSRCRDLGRRAPDPGILAVLSEPLLSALQSPALVWSDPLSGLTWDVARYFMLTPHDYKPDDTSDMMNVLRYGGHHNWRLPTINELKTLGNERYFHIGLIGAGGLVAYRQWKLDRAALKTRQYQPPSQLNIWSSKTDGDPDEHWGVNLHELSQFWQRYSEENSRYAYRAQTVMVAESNAHEYGNRSTDEVSHQS